MGTLISGYGCPYCLGHKKLTRFENIFTGKLIRNKIYSYNYGLGAWGISKINEKETD